MLTIQAGEQYEAIEMHHEAAVCYQLGKAYESAALNFETTGMYSDALDCYVAGSQFEEGVSFIKRTLQQQNAEEPLSLNKISVFVSAIVKKYHTTTKKANAPKNSIISDAIHLLPYDTCVTLLKTNKYYEELAELYIEHKQWKEAAQIYSVELVRYYSILS